MSSQKMTRIKHLQDSYITESGRSHLGSRGGACTSPPPPPALQFLNQKNVKQLQFQTPGFLWVFRNYTDQKFNNFYRVSYNFWTISGDFSFFLTTYKYWLEVGPSEKVRYLTLDLLKIFSLWTIRKKTTMNESLNVWL